MRKNLALFIFVLLAICAFGAPKGGSPLEVLSRIPDVKGTNVTPVYSAGAWVEYLATDDKGEQTKMKFSILSKEKCDSLDCFWFELKMTDKDKQWVILKFKGTDPKKQESVTSFIMQTQGEPAYEMSFMIPKQDGKKAEKDTDKPEIKPEITITENVMVTVPAGTFITKKIAIKDPETEAISNAYISEKVPIMGVVKGDQQKEGNIELIGYSNEGAKSEITGEVQKLEMPNLQNMMKGMMQPPPGE